MAICLILSVILVVFLLGVLFSNVYVHVFLRLLFLLICILCCYALITMPVYYKHINTGIDIQSYTTHKNFLPFRQRKLFYQNATLVPIHIKVFEF